MKKFAGLKLNAIFNVFPKQINIFESNKVRCFKNKYYYMKKICRDVYFS